MGESRSKAVDRQTATLPEAVGFGKPEDPEVKMRWHYTTGQNFALIIADGFIRPATAGVPARERPIVWFSTNQFWEETASTMRVDPQTRTLVNLNMMETYELGGGLVRIGVAPETAPYDFRALKERSGMSSDAAAAMYRAGIDHGAKPSEWWGTFDPVPRDKWIAVEVFDGKKWIPQSAPCGGLLDQRGKVAE